MKIRSFELSDENSVVQLWQDCGLVVPWNNPRRDIQRKLRKQPGLFFVGSSEGKIIATVMAGYDGHRGWIYYLAVHPKYRRIGIGKRMVDEVESRLRAVGCPKINLQVRRANTGVVAFYRSCGFREDDVMSLGKRLEMD